MRAGFEVLSSRDGLPGRSIWVDRCMLDPPCRRACGRAARKSCDVTLWPGQDSENRPSKTRRDRRCLRGDQRRAARHRRRNVRGSGRLAKYPVASDQLASAKRGQLWACRQERKSRLRAQAFGLCTHSFPNSPSDSVRLAIHLGFDAGRFLRPTSNDCGRAGWQQPGTHCFGLRLAAVGGSLPDDLLEDGRDDEERSRGPPGVVMARARGSWFSILPIRR